MAAWGSADLDSAAPALPSRIVDSEDRWRSSSQCRERRARHFTMNVIGGRCADRPRRFEEFLAPPWSQRRSGPPMRKGSRGELRVLSARWRVRIGNWKESSTIARSSALVAEPSGLPDFQSPKVRRSRSASSCVRRNTLPCLASGGNSTSVMTFQWIRSSEPEAP